MAVWSMRFVSRGATGLVQRGLTAEDLLAPLCAPWDKVATAFSPDALRGGAGLERGAAGGGGAGAREEG